MAATVAPLSAGQITYYVSRYYLDGQAEGKWLETEGGRRFSLDNQAVEKTHFERLLNGFHPEDGTPLVQNAGKENRQLGWDIQFGIDKSFSVLYALCPEARSELETSLRQAVTAAVSDVLEPQFLETRRGKGGLSRESATAPVAGFLHRTNRENEIHLHYHAVMPNLGVRSDGTTGTIVSWNLYDAKMALGKAFHARFVEEVQNRLGIRCEFDEHGLSRVKHFPEEMARALSTPSRTIAEVSRDGSAEAKEEANLKIRQSKRAIPFEQVEHQTREIAEALGFSAATARAFLGTIPEGPEQKQGELTVAPLLDSVLSKLPEQFSKAQLIERAFLEGAKAGLPFSEIRQGVEETLSDQSKIESLGRIERREMYAQVAGPTLRHEERILEDMSDLREAFTVVEATTPTVSLTELRAEHDALQQRYNAELSRSIEGGIETAPELRTEEVLPVVELAPPSSLAEVRELETRLAREVAGEAISDCTVARDRIDLAIRTLAQLVEAKQEQRGVQPEHSAEVLNTSFDINSPHVVEAAETFKKNQGLERDWLRTAQQDLGLSTTEARSLANRVVAETATRKEQRLIDRGVEVALSKVVEHESHFTPAQFANTVRSELGKTNVPQESLRLAIDKALADPKRTHFLGQLDGDLRYTTTELYNAERDGLNAAKALQERQGIKVAPERLEAVLNKFPELTPEQREAVGTAVNGSKLVVLQGESGEGMHSVQKAIQAALARPYVEHLARWARVHDVVFVAPSNAAAQELKRSSDAQQVTTLYRLNRNLDRGIVDTVKHHGSMIVNAALGEPTWKARQISLSSNTTVVLDSANLADTKELSRLLINAERSNARVVVCGTHEMSSLGPGGFVRELSHQSHWSQVAEIGDEAPARMVSLVGDSPKDRLLARWSDEAKRKPQEHLMVAASRDDVRDLNQQAQAIRKEAGQLGFRSIVIRYKETDQDGNTNTHKERIYEGDRVQFTGRSQKEVINGVQGTVKHIDLITGRIKVQLDLPEKRWLPWEFQRNKTIEFSYRNVRWFQRQEEGFRLGYAMTVNRAQNVMVEKNSYVLAGGPGHAPTRIYSELGLAKGKVYLFDEVEAGNRKLEPKLAAHTIEREAKQVALEHEKSVQQLKEQPSQQPSQTPRFEQKQDTSLSKGFGYGY